MGRGAAPSILVERSALAPLIWAPTDRSIRRRHKRFRRYDRTRVRRCCLLECQDTPHLHQQLSLVCGEHALNSRVRPQFRCFRFGKDFGTSDAAGREYFLTGFGLQEGSEVALTYRIYDAENASLEPKDTTRRVTERGRGN